MRHNQLLTYEEIRDEAAQAIASYPGTQTDLASEMGYTRAYISRAKTEVGPRIAKVQAEIIARLTPYDLREEVEVRFRAVRRDS
ncbi:MAG: hypothetical protein AAFV01_10690 [Bacteroidota bacterium]